MNEDKLLNAQIRIVELENALSYVINEADELSDYSHGKPVRTKEMDAARKLLKDNKPFTATKLAATNYVYWK